MSAFENGFNANAFGFPFKPYDIQVKLMSQIEIALNERKVAILSSPTGTGKSLSLICATLSWLQQYRQEVKSQLMRELSDLNEETSRLEEQVKDWISLHAKKSEKMERKINVQKAVDAIVEREQRLKQLKQRLKSNARCLRVESRVKKIKPIVEVDEATFNSELVVNYESDGETDADEEKTDEERMMNEVKPMVIYCSRTHSQLTQFVNELKSTSFKDSIRLVSLASRSTLCVNQSVNHLRNIHLLNEKCLELRKKSTKCGFYKQSLVNETRDEILSEVHDIEEVSSIGRHLNACPYYASRSAAVEADIVVVPYNILLHSQTRKSFGIDLRDNIVIIDEAHNLLETISSIHSVVINGDQILNCHSKLMEYLLRYNKRLNSKNLMYIKQMTFVLSSLLKMLNRSSKSDVKNEETDVCSLPDFALKCGIDNINLFKLLTFCEKSQIAKKLHSFSSNNCVAIENSSPTEAYLMTGTNAFLAKMKSQKMTSKKNSSRSLQSKKASGESINTKAVPQTQSNSNMASAESNSSSSSLFPIVEFIRALTNVSFDGRIVICRNAAHIRQSTLKFLLLNPAAQFQEIAQESRSVLLVGGTMQPFSEFVDHLLKPVGVTEDRILRFACGHVISDNNLLPICIGRGPSKDILLNFSFKSRCETKLVLEAGRVVGNMCGVIPGGVVVFFCSYEYEEKVYSIWKKNGVIAKFESVGKRVFRESKDTPSVTELLSAYKRSVNLSKGAILLSVVGGKMSEGINFADDFGRAVIVLGLPFPNVTSAEVKEKMNFLDTMKQGEGQKYYLNSCMKAVNQSIGRVIRHANDYATIILVDTRYTNRQEVVRSLSSWILEKLKVMNDFDSAVKLVESFFKCKKS